MFKVVWGDESVDIESRPVWFKWRKVGEKEWREGKGTVTDAANGRVEFRIPSTISNGETIEISHFWEGTRE